MGFAEKSRQVHALIAYDMEQGLVDITTIKTLPHKDRRWYLRKKKRTKLLPRVTLAFAAAITIPVFDAYRTDKMHFYSGTTARIEAK